jgi:phosphonopyruvate decarboxylase
MIKRDDCIRLIARHHTDEIVVPLYQAAFEWHAIKPWPLTYYAFGAMGQGSSHGLGFALGRPDKRVLVLDGDGSLLMNLGTLVTIATVAPPNLLHFVFENGTYEANGAHPIPGQGRVSFAGIARAAGIEKAFEFTEIDDFAAELPGILAMRGPVFVDLKVIPGAKYEYRWDVVHGPEARGAFREAMRADMARPR